MKKKHLRMFRRIFAGTAILAILVPVRAQVSNPSAWGDFVKGKENPLVVDTFRMQTFSQSDVDNWQYTAGNGAIVLKEEKKLKIPLGGNVSFESYSLESFQRVSAVITFTVQSVVSGEELLVELDNKNGKRSGVVYPNGKNPALSVRFGSNPYRLNFSTSSPASNSKGGYFLIDSMYAYDTIPKYSHFSGTGNWNDKPRWSNLPPLRRRCALISGTATINSSIECQTASLGNGGSLAITENGHFIVNNLFLHSTDNPPTATDFSLTVQGELSVKEYITLQYTFPEKGKWYFLSFPFDVYLKEIDNRFQLKDEQFTGNGDYFYMLTYNGDKRSSTQTPTGNWEVFSLPVSSDNPLVFERGKGYLVALDAAASDNTLTFSVEGENIPEDFGKTVSIPVNVASSMDAGDDNSGWYLCGNPLPAPLKLSQIQPDPALDGNIYLYDGKNYAPYAIGSNYELPPLAAFFVKASATTDLTVTNEPSTAKAVLLKSGYPLRSELTEPINVKTQLLKIRKENETSILKGNVLYLSGLSSVGKLKVVDVAGQLVYSCPVPQGSSVQSLPLRGGLYILIIEAGGYRAQHKCVLAQ
ncbi:T9SS type A sorting domain-containing protein [Parabacteroides sp.]|uniref:T9SS type A sorting domain-containing protein n=1 Tax=Parabacteroides sp. TaxID=1869337 RepID=UPI00259BD17D|nr:T9SS type A sorting domain-containing protein [uncultured Parabacteroides sp.]